MPIFPSMTLDVIPFQLKRPALVQTGSVGFDNKHVVAMVQTQTN